MRVLEQQLQMMEMMRSEIKELREKVDWLSGMQIPQTLSLRFNDKIANFKFESIVNAPVDK
jgi:FAD synthase